MHYTLQPWPLSNYQITIFLTAEELAWFKSAALAQFQKDAKIDGFRPWHAPLAMVEERVSPEYLKVAMYEEALHANTGKLLQEHADKKFIGQMYDLRIDDAKPDAITLTFTLDVYPEIVQKDTNREKLSAPVIQADASPEEIEETITNLKRQYASYAKADIVGEKSVFKVSLSFVDKSWSEVHTGKLYLWKEDLEEFPLLKTLFIGKKADEVISVEYDEKKLPPTMHVNKEWIQANTINATVGDIQDMELPEFTAENLKKFFWNEEVKSEEELREKIKLLVSNQKEEQVLMQTIDTYLQEVMKSFSLAIPKTLIDEEVKTRMKSLQERMWGEEWVKKYFEQIGEEEVKKLYTNISTAAKQSLEKFLILKDVVEKLGITDIKWDAHLDVEKKLYAKIKQ